MTQRYSTPPEIHEGAVLAGKYRIEQVLGIGGMGVVVAAHHLQLDQRVALKFLLPEMLANEEAVGRFTREARAAVRIRSEHVARVLDVGTLETGAPYMVMEFLEGGDLGAWLKQRGALPIEQAIEFVIQACVAVAEAHGLGIVHRDLKPANLFCVRGADGRLAVKVLDFGISKLTTFNTKSPDAATKTSAIMGSPLYMSPEQMPSAKDVDAGTDIWALGVVLYELLTGRVPFLGETMAEIIVKVATTAPAPLRAFRPDIPEELERVVLRCLEKDRRQRYANVGELAVALLPFAPRTARAAVEKITAIIQSAGLSLSALAIPASPREPPIAERTGTAIALGRTTGAQPRGPGLAIAVAAVFVFLLAGAAVLALRFGAGGHDATNASTSAAQVEPKTTATPTVAIPTIAIPAATLPAAPVDTPPIAAIPADTPGSTIVPAVVSSDAAAHLAAAASVAPSSAAPAPPAARGASQSNDGKSQSAPIRIGRSTKPAQARSRPHRLPRRHPPLPVLSC